MTQDLSKRIADLARDGTLSDGTSCRIIDLAAIHQLSKEAGVSEKTVEIAALKQSILPNRYLRNRKSLTIAEQIKLLESSICIVGLGGLGGLVTETAARLGIGRLLLIDGDVFEAHNLNRQLMSRVDCIDTPKADVAARRVKAIHPGVTVMTRATHLTAANAETLMDVPCDLVVDCLDNIRSRFDLEAAAGRAGIPMVSSAIAGMCGHVTTIHPGDNGLEAIYGPPEKAKRATGAERELGCLAPAVNLIASLASAEVLKLLLGRKDHLRNRLLVVDLNDYTFEALQLC